MWYNHCCSRRAGNSRSAIEKISEVSSLRACGCDSSSYTIMGYNVGYGLVSNVSPVSMVYWRIQAKPV